MTGTTDALEHNQNKKNNHKPQQKTKKNKTKHTTCPRLTIWEDAVDRGYVARQPGSGQAIHVAITASGEKFLREHGRIG